MFVHWSKLPLCRCASTAPPPPPLLAPPAPCAQAAELIKLDAADAATSLLAEVENRVTSLLRALPLEQVGTLSSDARRQILHYCEACPQSSGVIPAQARNWTRLIAGLLDHANLAATGRALQAVTAETSAVTAFLSKHKTGVAIVAAAQAAVDKNEQGQELDKRLEEMAALLDDASSERLCDWAMDRTVVPFWRLGQEVQALREKEKQAVRPQETALFSRFWQWVTKCLPAELQNSVTGVMEELLSEFSKPDSEPLGEGVAHLAEWQACINYSELVQHKIWEEQKAKATMPGKVREVLASYRSLAEDLSPAVAFALSKKARCQPMFKDASSPPNIKPSTLHSWSESLLKRLQAWLEPGSESDRIVPRFQTWILGPIQEELSIQSKSAFGVVADLVDACVQDKTPDDKSIERAKVQVPMDGAIAPCVDAFFQVPAVGRRPGLSLRLRSRV